MAFRLKLKVHTVDGKDFVVSHVLSEGSAGRVVVFLTSDDATLPMVMTVGDYNNLPYRWFEDMGPAPKASAVKPMEL